MARKLCFRDPARFASIVNQTGRILVPLLMSSALLACAKPETRAQSYYDKAMELIQKKDDTAARIELYNAIKYKADKVEAWRALAGVDERTGATKALFNDLHRIVELDPSDMDAKLRFARMLVQGRAADAAEPIVESIHEGDKPNAELHALRATIQLQRRDSKSAVAEAEKAISIDASNADAALIVAADHITRADFDGALQIIEPANKDAQDARLSALKIQVLERKGDLAGAEAELQRLVAANPKEAIYHAQLAQLYAAQKRNAEAEKELRTIAEIKPDDSRAGLDVVRFIAGVKGRPAAQQELEARIKQGGAIFDYQIALAEMEFAQGQVEQAKALLLSLVGSEKSAENVAVAKTKLAEFYAARNDNESAEKLVNEVLEKDRRNTTALRLRSGIRIAQGRIDDAISDLREALNDQPKSPELLISLAQAYERGDKIELADRQYNEALRSSNFNPNVGLVYAGFLRRISNPSRAEGILTDLTARYPDNAALWSSLAQLKLSQQDWTGAAQVAETISKLGNNDALAFELKAAALSGQNRPDESIAALEQARAAAPNDLQPVVNLVLVYAREKKFDQAMGVLQQALTKSPDNPQLIGLKAQVQVASGVPDQAINTLKQAIAKEPKNISGYAALAQIYTQQKRYDDAIGSIDEALKIKPDDVNLRSTRANLLIAKNDPDGAIAGFEKLLNEQPNSLVIINNLASLLLDYRSDKASIDRAVQLSERLKGIKLPQFQDTVGWALYQRGDYSGSSSLLEQAKAQLPNSAAVRYHLGMAYRSQGQETKAQAELKSAFDLEAGDTPLKQKIQSALKARG